MAQIICLSEVFLVDVEDVGGEVLLSGVWLSGLLSVGLLLTGSVLSGLSLIGSTAELILLRLLALFCRDCSVVILSQSLSKVSTI